MPRWIINARHEVWWWLRMRASNILHRVWDADKHADPPAWIAAPFGFFERRRYRAQFELMYRHNPVLWAEWCRTHK